MALFWVLDYARAHSVMCEQGIQENTLNFLESTVIGFLDIGIASQTFLLSAEPMGLGGTYAGSIRNNVEVVIAELGLPKYTFPVVGMALGYPDPNEGTGVKPRLPQGAVLHFERYDSEAWRDSAVTYDLTFSDYYASQGKPDQSWTRTMSKRLSNIAALNGRERLREFMTRQGLDSE